jgi:hypothetical protein
MNHHRSENPKIYMDTRCAEDGNSVPTKRVVPTCHIARWHNIGNYSVNIHCRGTLKYYVFTGLNCEVFGSHKTAVFCDVLFLNRPS